MYLDNVEQAFYKGKKEATLHNGTCVLILGVSARRGRGELARLIRIKPPGASPTYILPREIKYID